MRIGHGYDIHRIQRGGRMVLGGVGVSTTSSLIAHSDGDVVLHALVDALLGALGKGDIGEMFPNTDPRWKSADSKLFVTAAMNDVRSAGYKVANADITILAERPRLKPFKPEMARIISALIGAPVNIKAGTNEGCDAVGQEQAIACHAVVLLTTDA